MLKITGYPDRVSVASGQTVQFMVNCEYPRYKASVVRVVQGDSAPEAPPVKLVPLASSIDGDYAGRKQTIRAGSFATIDAGATFAASPGLSLQAMIMPTTPQKGRQAVISKWDEETGKGICLVVAADGSVGIEVSDAASRISISVGKPMLARHWYFAAACYDAATGEVKVWQQPQHAFATIDDAGSASARGPARLNWENEAPLLFAATWGGLDAGRPVGCALYNGKIDRPRVSHSAANCRSPGIAGR